jgi:hypothetical protein
MTITSVKAIPRSAVVTSTGDVVQSGTGVTAPYAPGGPLIAGTSKSTNVVDITATGIFKIEEFGRSFFPGTRLRASAADVEHVWMEGLSMSWDGETLTLDPDLVSGSGSYMDWEINVAGERGQVGPEGPIGPSGGPPGPQGIQGIAGTPGAVWRDGTGVPSNALGVNGDYYLDDATGNVYLKSVGSYALATNIKGPQGPVGAGVIEEAPIDGTFYSRRNAAWSPPPGGGDVQHTRNLIAGAGLTGGGDLSADRTFNVGAGTGITVAADTIGLTVPVAITSGGTGATDAATALVNLGGFGLASPVFTGNPQAPTPSVGDNDTSIATTAFVQNALLLSTHGHLKFVSGTQIAFTPLNGNKFRIAGINLIIPTAGIIGGNTGVYINGIAGQNLSASATYLVTAFNNSGTPTFDFLTTLTHAPDTASGNEGVEIKGGDNTRSVVGMVRMNTAGQFSQNLVISWFNRRLKYIAGQSTAVQSSAPSLVELNSIARIEILNWADEAVWVSFSGLMFSNTPGALVTASIGLDGSVSLLSQPPQGNAIVENYQFPVSGSAAIPTTEGYHYLTPLGMTNTGIATFYLVASALSQG